MLVRLLCVSAVVLVNLVASDDVQGILPGRPPPPPPPRPPPPSPPRPPPPSPPRPPPPSPPRPPPVTPSPPVTPRPVPTRKPTTPEPITPSPLDPISPKPTPEPTPQPTPASITKPTPMPTPQPTPQPTPAPTTQPPPQPPPQPTPMSTPQPTPGPTPQPTPVPTPMPTPTTPQPTPQMTPTPTPEPETPELPSCSAIEDDIDYDGTDVGSVDRDSPEECCADCASTANCNLFVWFEGTCWLKSDAGTKSTSLGRRAAWLKPPPPTTCSRFEDNTDYFGNDIGSTERSSAEECCADCAATDGCGLFVWTQGTCWLKSAAGEPSDAPGAAAGFMT
ncbi:Aste57867_8638 [Aphanomyces stellatus]|uniref:Aste57867_8638 protein n=1 Tax=Aphanomyces stellatus TaxID=120398 RepID=A0A485KKV8_9STRA|nr:hypothetical protein As57867_008604 [Aphanomyces stellatus]VFT85524.1 Aste57867_8638 [Aphanomyces stellatus]